MRFNRGQYINGKQVSAGQSFVITDIKDKQKITIQTQGKQYSVKADHLFLSGYNYVNTLNKYPGKAINNCIYYPSTDKSKQSFQQDIYSVASKTKEKLTVYTSDNLLSQNIKVKTNLYLDMESNQQPNGISKVQASPDIQSENIQPSVSLNDNTLFNIASSANHLVIDLGVSSNTDEQRVYHSPDGVMIETDPQNLSIYYDGKTLQFDQDFNVKQNQFSNKELEHLSRINNQKLEQHIQQNRHQQITQNIELSW
ncbi:MAG: hypothetical protein ACRC2S_00390 [Waterburya sp.]